MKNKLNKLLICLLCIGCIATPAISVFATETDQVSVTESTEEESTDSAEAEWVDLNKVSIQDIPDQVFTGKPCSPSIALEGLTEGEDFTVTYQKNIVPGTATVVITGIGNCKGTVEREFNIILPQTTVTGIENTSSGIKLSWEEKSGVSGYYIYRKTEDTKYSKLDIVQETSTYIDTNVSAGTKYTYQIKVYYGDSVGRSSSEVDMKYLSKPSVEASHLSSGIQIKWKENTGADGYYIYRKKANESDYQKVKTIANGNTVSWTDTSAKKDIKYLYTLKAYSGDFISCSSNAAYVVPMQPKLKSASSVSYTSIKVNWNNVSGEDGYYIYRKTTGTTWKRVAEVAANKTSWTDKGLICGTSYTYSVRAFVKADSGVLLSSYHKTGVSAKPVPAAPVLNNTTCNSSSVTVTWKKAAGAKSYYIYRKTQGGNWKKLASVGSSVASYKDKTAAYGVKYYYTVKSMRDQIIGKYNTSGIQGACLVNTITMKSICITSAGKATVKWSKASCADGYFIYRKESGGSWKKVGTVISNKTTWTESGLGSGKEYWYRVAGYMTLNGKKVKGNVSGSGIAPRLEYTGEFVRNVTKTYLGKTGGGRNMYSYTIGSGKNHIVSTMAIHAWEDNWARDGAVLVKTGNKLIQKASENLSTLNKYDYSLIIVPMANPDGLYSGTSCNGPGRCTVYRYNSSGKLVKGGIDLNRAFPAGFHPKYNTRNYTGSKSLMSKEAVILKNFVDSSKGSGKNIFIDAHGWFNQIITYRSGTGNLYRAFKAYFPGSRGASFGRGLGYISGYAQSKGYEAALFEFPYVSSEKSFNNNNYANKYMDSIFYMVKNIK